MNNVYVVLIVDRFLDTHIIDIIRLNLIKLIESVWESEEEKAKQTQTVDSIEPLQINATHWLKW